MSTSGALPIQTPVSPNGKYVITANTLSATITIIDTDTDELVKVLPCSAGCHGVNFGAKKGGGYYAYVSSKFSNDLIVVEQYVVALARCTSTLRVLLNRLRLRARMESSAANHRLMFDTEALPYLFGEYDDGFARQRSYRFGVNGPGPFFDVEGAEANLTLTLTEANGPGTVTHRVRVRLSFTPQPDLPDVDPSPPPTPTRAP